MYIYKSYIDNYIKCPHYFALTLLDKDKNDPTLVTEYIADVLKKATRSKSYKVTGKSNIKRDIEWLKDSISKIASNEMVTGVKAPISEYRIQYTNKYFKNILTSYSTVEGENIINRLNNVFAIFSSSIFLGFNVPIEIPLLKTNLIYRDMFDFLLCDINDPEKITIVEIDDLSNPLQARKYREWSHYKIPYLFLADSLQSNINVIIIDPINTSNRVELSYMPRKFNDIHESCSKIALDVINPVLYKNLHSCDECIYTSVCLNE